MKQTKRIVRHRALMCDSCALATAVAYGKDRWAQRVVEEPDSSAPAQIPAGRDTAPVSESFSDQPSWSPDLD